jgi:intergrase/recombinase
MEKENLLLFRLKNLRSRKRIIKRAVEKLVRTKYKHHGQLWKMKRNIPLVPLEKPYQKGFVRFFVVRDNVKRSKDGRFFEDLLKKINTEMYSPTRKFLKKKRRRGRKIYVPREQRVANIYPHEWDNPKFGLTER